ncbi:MAG: DNA phosphorothioation system sulfurtransferase DndC, partial [Shewanella sp.]
DTETEWMLPLLQLRNEIDVNDSNRDAKVRKINRDKSNRDFRRMNGSLTVHINEHGADLVRGPYRQPFREHMLQKVLEAQKLVQEIGPDEVRNLELLSREDLEAIRTLWLEEKHEVEDSVPRIYAKVFGKPYEVQKNQVHSLLNANIMDKLKEKCAQYNDPDGLLYEQLRTLLTIEERHSKLLRRAKLYTELNKSLETMAFNNIEEARDFALNRRFNENKIKLLLPHITEAERQQLEWENEKLIESLSKENDNSRFLENEQIEIEERSV